MNNWRVNQRGNRWTVERNMPCINGLSAWVEVVDCGEDDPSDEMFGGFDRRHHALLCLSALAGCDISHARDAFEAGLHIGGSIAGCYESTDDAAATQARPVSGEAKPLTDEEIIDGWGHKPVMDLTRGPPRRSLERELGVFMLGARFAERAHNIAAPTSTPSENNHG